LAIPVYIFCTKVSANRIFLIRSIGSNQYCQSFRVRLICEAVAPGAYDACFSAWTAIFFRSRRSIGICVDTTLLNVSRVFGMVILFASLTRASSMVRDSASRRCPYRAREMSSPSQNSPTATKPEVTSVSRFVG
jgi:hypothetical protein